MWIFSCHSLAQSRGDIPAGKADNQKLMELDWFSEGYEQYQPDSSYVGQIRAAKDNYSFVVFAGEWCGDTRNLLPKFYKTADLAGIPRDKITLYFLNRRKKSPEKIERNYNIDAIPAFVLIKDGKEAGRIVEEADGSIEKELSHIMH